MSSVFSLHGSFSHLVVVIMTTTKSVSFRTSALLLTKLETKWQTVSDYTSHNLSLVKRDEISG